ncbi:MAG: hypothetical protein NDI90_11265 [Nitrospira sp. BO4]|nr:hypothetical protein [Nitrospira sp. BO4]
MDRLDIQFYVRPAIGYQVILFARDSNYLGIHPTLHTVIEYQYGSRYSYPARDEADAREQAVSYAISAIRDHYARLGTWAEARIYPFGGLIRDMRLIERRSRRGYDGMMRSDNNEL